MTPAEQQPERQWLRELKRARGAELRRRHGAHALGIGRRRGPHGERTDTLALIFYVDPGAAAGAEPVPEHIAFRPAGLGHEVQLPTAVVTSPPAVFE